MRRLIAMTAISVSLLVTPLAWAEEQLSSDQLRRMYDDAVAQMKSAQDRRNDLARQNEKLQARIAQLEKDLAETQTQLTSIADSTFQARAESAAFSDFLRANPAIKAQWFLYLQKSLLSAPDPRAYLDPDWPFSANGGNH